MWRWRSIVYQRLNATVAGSLTGVCVDRLMLRDWVGAAGAGLAAVGVIIKGIDEILKERDIKK